MTVGYLILRLREIVAVTSSDSDVHEKLYELIAELRDEDPDSGLEDDP